MEIVMLMTGVMCDYIITNIGLEGSFVSGYNMATLSLTLDEKSLV